MPKEAPDRQDLVRKWEKIYRAGLSLRDIETDVSPETVRTELHKARVELRPRGGPNDGKFRVGDERAHGIPLHEMTVEQRVDSFVWVNAPVLEVLFILTVTGDVQPGIFVGDVTLKLPDLTWIQVDRAYRALERRMFAVGAVVDTRFGPRRFYRITEDGVQAAKILGLSRKGPTKKGRKTPSGGLASRAPRKKRGTFSVGDGRPRKVPLASMTLDERVRSLSFVAAPVWEVLDALCMVQDDDGPGLFTSAICKSMPGEAWQSVDNACKALDKRGFVTRQAVDTPTGHAKTATKITADGVAAAMVRRARRNGQKRATR